VSYSKLMSGIAALQEYAALQSAQQRKDQVLNLDHAEHYPLDFNSASTKESPLHLVKGGFKSFVFQNGTSQSTKAKVILGRTSRGKAVLEFGRNAKFSNGTIIDQMTVFGDQQVNETMDLYIFRDGDFSSGETINSGAVTPRSPSSISAVQTVALSLGANVAAIPANSNRSKLRARNNSGGAIYLMAANNTVYVDTVPNGDIFEHNNKGALNIFADNAGDIFYVEEEE
jgi:hypothetical protein